MGVEKKISRRKTETLHIRLTPTDMAIIRERCALSGYRSLTRFVTRILVDERMPFKRDRTATLQSDNPEWINSHLNIITQQIKGIAANYNQSVAVMNTLCKSIDDRKVKYMIVKQVARLESLTREMICQLHDIKDDVLKLSAKGFSETTDGDD